MRHTHYTVQCFDEERAPGEFVNLVTQELIASDEGQAISKAQKFAWGRQWYRITSVIEHDPDLEVDTQASEPIIQQLKSGELTLDRIQILERTGEIKILPDLMAIKKNESTPEAYMGESDNRKFSKAEWDRITAEHRNQPILDSSEETVNARK